MDHYPVYSSNLLFYVLHWVVSALALFLTSKLVPGFRLKNFKAALIAALAIVLADYTVYWLILFLTLPLVILTFGLFLFVINAIILKICASLLRDFEITNWGSAIVGALVVMVLGNLLHYFIV